MGLISPGQGTYPVAYTHLDVYKRQRIHEVVGTLSELVHGFDFAQLLVMYYRAYVNDDEDTKAKVVKWFRGCLLYTSRCV